MDIKTKNHTVSIISDDMEVVENKQARKALEEAIRMIDLQTKKRPWDAEPTIFDKAATKAKKTSKKVTEGWGKLSFTEKCMAVTTGTIALKVTVSAFRELRLAWRFR